MVGGTKEIRHRAENETPGSEKEKAEGREWEGKGEMIDPRVSHALFPERSRTGEGRMGGRQNEGEGWRE